MKTKVVTIRHNHALVKLSLMAGDSIDKVVDKILTCLIRRDALYDIPEECGLTLDYLLEQTDNALQDFGNDCFHKCTDDTLDVLKGIQTWGLGRDENDCDVCGCEMEYDCIAERRECINGACNCSINMNNKPDPDEGRDDCKMSNPMLLPYLKTYNLN